MTESTLMQPIALNLQRLRLARGLSLSGLAQKAGVGKSTIFNLERGQGNPAIDTLWSLARALRVPIGELLTDTTLTDINVLRRTEAPALVDDCRLIENSQDGAHGNRVPGAFVSRHLVSTHRGGQCELHWIEIASGVVHQSSGHTPGVVESVIPVEGTLWMRINDEHVSLSPGDRMTFSADRSHSYETQGEPVMLISLLEYPPSPQ